LYAREGALLSVDHHIGKISYSTASLFYYFNGDFDAESDESDCWSHLLNWGFDVVLGNFAQVHLAPFATARHCVYTFVDHLFVTFAGTAKAS
jgi:hypothetical protein